MQDFFFVGMICALALGVFLIKSILFVIHLKNFKQSNKIIQYNQAQLRLSNIQTQQIQGTNRSIETVINWKIEDPRLTEDLRQQFLTKTKTRRTPTNDYQQLSPRERVPLATTDFGDFYQDDSDDHSVPIYTYDPSTGGTQV